MRNLYICKKCSFKSDRKCSAIAHLKSEKHNVGYEIDVVRARCKVCCKDFKYPSLLRNHKKTNKHKKNVELSKIDLTKIYNIIIIDNGIPKSKTSNDHQ